jgi:hypothetical protein
MGSLKACYSVGLMYFNLVLKKLKSEACNENRVHGKR